MVIAENKYEALHLHRTFALFQTAGRMSIPILFAFSASRGRPDYSTRPRRSHTRRHAAPAPPSKFTPLLPTVQQVFPFPYLII
jgi:hypothetical protein